MKLSQSLSFCALVACAGLSNVRAADDHRLSPASPLQPGVPQGEVTKFTWRSSKTKEDAAPDASREDKAKLAQRRKIRVFLQDGSNDLNNGAGNWPLANQEMAAALKFAGWDYKFVFGTGAHDHMHAAAIFPETMRWLWRDHTK